MVRNRCQTVPTAACCVCSCQWASNEWGPHLIQEQIYQSASTGSLAICHQHAYASQHRHSTICYTSCQHRSASLRVAQFSIVLHKCWTTETLFLSTCQTDMDAKPGESLQSCMNAKMTETLSCCTHVNLRLQPGQSDRPGTCWVSRQKLCSRSRL